MLSAPELLEFLEDQGEDGATLARAQQLIQTHELNETGGRPTDGLGSAQSGPPAEWAPLSLAVGCGCHLGKLSRLFQPPLPHL